MASENNTCKTKTTVINTMELASTLKSIKILNERVSKVNRDRISSSKIGELTLVEGGGCYLYPFTWVSFYAKNNYFCQKYTSSVVHRVHKDFLAG